MSHLILELALWVLFAFFLGCIIGCILHKLFGGGRAAVGSESPTTGTIESSANATTESQAEPAAQAVEADSAPAATVKEALPQAGKPSRPQGVAAARQGKADNLQRISGIGPKNEKTLHGLGFFHFDQIAAWTDEEIAWVDDHLKFNGRIGREEWTRQAKLLAEGKEEEFQQLYGTGGLRDKKGESESGTRTKKS
jgi:predicted flap endonuclease-1-like 5' DNA nuclease